ncbi:sodium-coupled monocarboxylate transporter 1-like [Zophobas morio]|uniref:sodium-coupled monocarboxylate transporter 1-like n=1 Tax=Zophobas morio TaxID=2755281 RepID=UPI00308344BF
MTFSNSTSVETVATVLPNVLKHVVQLSFSWYDYILFGIMLGVSALIGIYFGCFGTKQSTANEYLMGDKKMKVFPISVSLVASHVSGVTLLAVPADIYRYGASYWLFVFACLPVTLVIMFVYLPVFYKLQITSTYEYLERRFDSTNRMFASFLFAIGLFLYLPVVIYLPALALSAATGINLHYITPLVCGVCIFYTTLGGLKAVVWTDTIQFTVTTGAIFTVAVIGIKAAGGFTSIWSTAVEGQRLDIFDFDPNPTKRDSFWGVILGVSSWWLSMAGIHQSCVQKFLSLPTFREAKLSLIYFCVGITVVSSFSVFTGLMIYTRYADCDPLCTGAVTKHDQLLPYYIMDVASHIPGLTGLFIAGIFCAALSTLSACLNCLAGTMFEDFITKVTGPIKNEKTAAYILKFLVLITGVICTLLVFVVERLGGILPLVISLGSITSGPLLGLFTLGILFPKVSSRGAFYGSVFSLLFCGWIVVMAQYYKAQGLVPDIPKPVSTEGCSVTTNSTSFFSNFENFTTEMDHPATNWTYSDFIANHTQDFSNNRKYQDQKPFFLFRISHYYYCPVGTFVTIIFGLLVTCVLGNNDPPVDRDLLSPIIYSFLSDKEGKDEKMKEYYRLDKALHLVSVNSDKEEMEKIKS